MGTQRRAAARSFMLAPGRFLVVESGLSPRGGAGSLDGHENHLEVPVATGGAGADWTGARCLRAAKRAVGHRALPARAVGTAVRRRFEFRRPRRPEVHLAALCVA